MGSFSHLAFFLPLGSFLHVGSFLHPGSFLHLGSFSPLGSFPHSASSSPYDSTLLLFHHFKNSHHGPPSVQLNDLIHSLDEEARDTPSDLMSVSSLIVAVSLRKSRNLKSPRSNKNDPKPVTFADSTEPIPCSTLELVHTYTYHIVQHAWRVSQSRCMADTNRPTSLTITKAR